MKILNCTPHNLRIITPKGTITLPKSEIQIRVDITEKEWGEINEIPIMISKKGQTTGLPEYDPNVLLVVSQVVKDANPSRSDLLHPHLLVRDEDGQIVGCKSLSF